MAVAQCLEMRDDRYVIHIPGSVGTYAEVHDDGLTLWGQQVSKTSKASSNSSRGFNDPRQIFGL